MKFRNVGQVLLALVMSAGLGIGVTSCTNSYTVGYLYVPGSQYNQIAGFNINNQTGALTPVKKSPFGTAGTNPVRDLVLSGGRFLYVLNRGTFSYNPDGTVPKSAVLSNISLFQIGGNGVLTFQQSYTSQGNDSISMVTDSTGSHMYILDNYGTAKGQPIPSTAEQTAATPCQNPTDGRFYPTGDISAFNIDSTTGRLSLITNAQVANPDGTQLTYFPLGCFPVELKLVGGYIFTAQTGSASNNDSQTVFSYAQNASNGQLTLTQNAPLQTGATKITSINASPSGSYVYLLDAGPVTTSNCTGNQTAIRPFTIGSGGILQSLVGGTTCNDPTAIGPTVMLVDNKGKFLYVANTTNTGQNQHASEITAFTIDPTNGKLSFIAGQPFYSVGAGPTCILEDPTNQFIYTAGFNDSTVVGAIIDVNAGVLNPLRNKTSFPATGNPTRCAASGRTQ